MKIAEGRKSQNFTTLPHKNRQKIENNSNISVAKICSSEKFFKMMNFARRETQVKVLTRLLMLQNFKTKLISAPILIFADFAKW